MPVRHRFAVLVNQCMWRWVSGCCCSPLCFVLCSVAYWDTRYLRRLCALDAWHVCVSMRHATCGSAGEPPPVQSPGHVTLSTCCCSPSARVRCIEGQLQKRGSPLGHLEQLARLHNYRSALDDACGRPAARTHLPAPPPAPPLLRAHAQPPADSAQHLPQSSQSTQHGARVALPQPAQSPALAATPRKATHQPASCYAGRTPVQTYSDALRTYVP